jgi:hypothetical protein
MTRPKHDRLMAALIAKLPAEAGPWPRAGRIAWLQMMAMAFDVVYGPCSGIRVASNEPCRDDCRTHDAPAAATVPCHEQAEYRAAPQPVPGAAPRFYVDRDGFAMGDGRPIAMEDLPAGAILWDERVGIECGDASTILWRDTGTSRRGLPPGVTLQPVFDES